jgi:tRNA(adenine34) deaminase
MELALEQAEHAQTLGEVPVGALVLDRAGHVLAVGHNRRETDADPCGHAELIAIREAARNQGHWRLEGCTVVVTLEPCAMCAGAMVLARIERCVFGAWDPKAGFLGSVDDLHARPELNHAFDVVPGVLEQRCSAQLSAFFRALRARKKAARQS